MAEHPPDYMTGIESDSTDHIHEALAQLRAYLRYSHRGENLFPVEDFPESVGDAVTHGKELLEEIRRVMWKHKLTFISDFVGRNAFTVVVIYWPGQDTEWISLRYPLHMPKSWWTVPPVTAGRWALAQAVLAFLGVTQPKDYEHRIEALVSLEMKEPESIPSFEQEKKWELGRQLDDET